jgi:hypothetical protein
VNKITKIRYCVQTSVCTLLYLDTGRLIPLYCAIPDYRQNPDGAFNLNSLHQPANGQAKPAPTQISAKLAAVLVYSRPLLVFGGMICAVAVMWGRNPVIYTLGVSLLFVSMTFDLVDGWFAARYRPNAPLAHLADRLMDKLVYSIIFPVIAAGMMWRLVISSGDLTRCRTPSSYCCFA